MPQGPGHIVRSPDFSWNGEAYPKDSFITLPDEHAKELKRHGVIADPTPEELAAWNEAQAVEAQPAGETTFHDEPNAD